jgi:hypothetical protein
MGDLGTIGVEYCCSNTEVSLFLENINKFLSSFNGPNPRIISVIVCFYSLSKSRMAAIRTLRTKAAFPFMLLEKLLQSSHSGRCLI